MIQSSLPKSESSPGDKLNGFSVLDKTILQGLLNHGEATCSPTLAPAGFLTSTSAALQPTLQ